MTVPAATIAQLGLPASFANAVPFGQSVYFYMAKARLDRSMPQPARRSATTTTPTIRPITTATSAACYLVSRTYNFVDRSHVGAIQLISSLSANAVNEFRMQIADRSPIAASVRRYRDRAGHHPSPAWPTSAGRPTSGSFMKN